MKVIRNSEKVSPSKKNEWAWTPENLDLIIGNSSRSKSNSKKGENKVFDISESQNNYIDQFFRQIGII